MYTIYFFTYTASTSTIITSVQFTDAAVTTTFTTTCTAASTTTTFITSTAMVTTVADKPSKCLNSTYKLL